MAHGRTGRAQAARALTTGAAGVSRPAAALWPWWALWLAFVVYGSLVPLDFHPLPWGQAWRRLLDAPMFQLGVESRADWIANGVLYVPVGFMTAALVARQRRPGLGLRLFAAALAVALGIGLAIGVEFAQTAFPPRTVSRNDIVAEILGTVLGAVIGAVAAGRFQLLLARLGEGGLPLIRAMAPFYLAVYVLAALFPFDLLISATEWRDKLSGPQIGWLLTDSNRQLGRFSILAKLIFEALAVVPLGALYMGSRAKPRAKRLPRRPPHLWQAAWVGFLLGGSLELLQFAFASGQSQGLSVLARILGVTLGAWLWQHRGGLSAETLRAWVRRHSSALLWSWLPLLVAYHGLWRGPLLSAHQVESRLRNELHFLPFYYHYYTSELHAVISTVAVCTLYSPLGVQSWAWRSRTSAAVIAAMLLSGLIEAAKLFLKGARPDPTNVWLAGAAVWITHAILEKLSQRPRPPTDAGDRP